MRAYPIQLQSIKRMCGGVGLYKPSSLLRPYIADTSALSMLELGLMPVVTTMGRASSGAGAHPVKLEALW